MVLKHAAGMAAAAHARAASEALSGLPVEQNVNRCLHVSLATHACAYEAVCGLTARAQYTGGTCHIRGPFIRSITHAHASLARLSMTYNSRFVLRNLSVTSPVFVTGALVVTATPRQTR